MSGERRLKGFWKGVFSMYRFKGFTEKANTALNLAMEAAQDLGHTYIGTEHLVLGLLREGTGVAAAVLAAPGGAAPHPGPAAHPPTKTAPLAIPSCEPRS